MIEAILSFSTRTYPKSVLTLNMFSSYATITPYSFLPSLRRISSAEPGIAASASAQSDARRNPRFARTPILRVWAGPGKRRNWLAGHVSAILRGVLAAWELGIGVASSLAEIKRPAARESPKAMEPPAVSRFLLPLAIIANKKRISRYFHSQGAPHPLFWHKRLQAIENKGPGWQKE